MEAGGNGGYEEKGRREKISQLAGCGPGEILSRGMTYAIFRRGHPHHMPAGTTTRG